jgi:isopropylmalate/homocitrate/citramalate synthase
LTVFLVFINDRHSDTDAEVFTSAEAAIEYARTTAREFARSPEDYIEADVRGWLFFATYSVENDCVWVIEKELRTET